MSRTHAGKEIRKKGHYVEKEVPATCWKCQYSLYSEKIRRINGKNKKAHIAFCLYEGEGQRVGDYEMYVY